MVTLSLRRCLRQRGHEVLLFSSRAETKLHRGEADRYCFGTSSPLRALLWPANVSAYVRFRQVLKDFQPDVVHVRTFLSQLSPLILPPLRDIPAVYHEGSYRSGCPTATRLLPNGTHCNDQPGVACLRHHCVPVLAWPLVNFELSVWKRWSSVFDVVVANSQSVANRLREFGIPSVRYIPNGVPFREPRPPLENPKIIAFAGRLVPEKGVDDLIKAFASLVGHWPQTKLWIAGEGPARREFEQLAEELGLTADQVQFLGHLPRAKMERRFDQVWVQVVPSS